MAQLRNLENRSLKIATNSKAWMNEETMPSWIDNVWRLHAQQFPRSLIIMDHFHVHKVPSVLSKFESYNTDVLLIPPGLTFFCQPTDVYVNKPVKERVRKLWQEYIAESFLSGQSNLSLFLF